MIAAQNTTQGALVYQKRYVEKISLEKAETAQRKRKVLLHHFSLYSCLFRNAVMQFVLKPRIIVLGADTFCSKKRASP